MKFVQPETVYYNR